jgi:hypothetical protein
MATDDELGPGSTVIPQALFRDRRMSLEELGVLAELMSYHQDGTGAVALGDLCGPDDPREVASWLVNLQKLGYATERDGRWEVTLQVYARWRP